MTDIASIRRATAQDGPACAQIVNGWIDQTPWMPRTASASDIEAALIKGLPLREAYVIGDPVAGYISVEVEIDHIWGFYLAIQSQGAGKALLDHVKQGRTKLRLNSPAANTRAHAFYQREGFSQVGPAWAGDDGIDEITMEWHA